MSRSAYITNAIYPL